MEQEDGEQTIAKLSALPPGEQDTYAVHLLKELAAEQTWDVTFAASQAQLAQLADEALQEFQVGKTTPLGFSSRGKL